MRVAIFILLTFAMAANVSAQNVTYQRLLNADKEPQNWLTFSGSYLGARYSTLDQITPANAQNLELKWVFQTQSLQRMEATPLVVDGIMYVSQPPNDVVALDAKTGHVFWVYDYRIPPTAGGPCCGLNNRGLAILGDTVYMGTIDGHLVAIDAKSGHGLGTFKWRITVQVIRLRRPRFVVKDKIVMGAARVNRGFVAAYSAETGQEDPRKFNTIPSPGEPGNDTWPAGDAWKRGGASSWTTGSYDPDLNLIFWGTGNPWPDSDPQVREGDNLYTDSAIAIDADTGKMKWYFQFTPNDGDDWDSIQVPVLADMPVNGVQKKVICSGRIGMASFQFLRPRYRKVYSGQRVCETELGHRA